MSCPRIFQCGINTSLSADGNVAFGLCKTPATRFVIIHHERRDWRWSTNSFVLAVCEEHYALIQHEKIQDLTEQEYLVYQVHDE
jgi:hypothetical protein